MEYVNIIDKIESWKVSDRTARLYCAEGRIPGAKLEGRTWKVPKDAKKPKRRKRTSKLSTNLLTRLKEEKESGITGGIYHKIQIDLTYNSNHIEGSKLTHDQTRYIFETNTIGIQDEAIKVDDVVETVNHFRCVDLVIDMANYQLSESFIKQLHLVLKSGTTDSRKNWFAVGDYKKLPNVVGNKETTEPKNVSKEIKTLLKEYNANKKKSLEEIIEFHYKFESIHPFQDGNGRVGRLIMFKECLRNDIVPFIIEDKNKMYYYRGLNEWPNEPGYLIGTCLSAQDTFKEALNYFIQSK